MTDRKDRMSELIVRAGAAIERAGDLLDKAGAKAERPGVVEGRTSEAKNRNRVDVGRTSAGVERTSALADWSKRFAEASAVAANFSIREVPFVTQINVRGNADDPAFAAGMRSALGRDLPTGANTWTGMHGTAAIWLGPQEWMVTAPEGRNDTMEKLLRNSLRGVRCSVTDLSANRMVIEIAGKHARAVLAKGCPLDLHAIAFGPPQCAQTLLAKSQVLLQCIDERPLLRLYVRLSFAPYVAEWLVDAAAEFSASRGLDSDRIAARLN